MLPSNEQHSKILSADCTFYKWQSLFHMKTPSFLQFLEMPVETWKVSKLVSNCKQSILRSRWHNGNLCFPHEAWVLKGQSPELHHNNTISSISEWQKDVSEMCKFPWCISISNPSCKVESTTIGFPHSWQAEPGEKLGDSWLCFGRLRWKFLQTSGFNNFDITSFSGGSDFKLLQVAKPCQEAGCLPLRLKILALRSLWPDRSSGRSWPVVPNMHKLQLARNVAFWEARHRYIFVEFFLWWHFDQAPAMHFAAGRAPGHPHLPTPLAACSKNVFVSWWQLPNAPLNSWKMLYMHSQKPRSQLYVVVAMEPCSWLN